MVAENELDFGMDAAEPGMAEALAADLVGADYDDDKNIAMWLVR